MSALVEEKLKEIGHHRLAATAIFIKEGRVLLGLRHYTPDKWKVVSVWTTPGGRCDENETVESTLRREVIEEVGFMDFKVERFFGEIPGAKEGDIVYVFECSTNEEPRLMEPEKFSEWKWFNVDEVPSNFINQAALEFLRSKIK